MLPKKGPEKQKAENITPGEIPGPSSGQKQELDALRQRLSVQPSEGHESTEDKTLAVIAQKLKKLPDATPSGNDRSSISEGKNDKTLESSEGDMSSREIVRQAIDKGRERVQRADDLRKNLDIPSYNAAARAEYAGRYRTEVEPFDGETVEIHSYVQGENVKESCYDNYVRVDEDSGKAHFVQQSNYKRRTLHYQAENLRARYPEGCGKFDDEVKWNATEPSSHGKVLFNQIESYQNYARENNLPPLDFHPYEGVELVNRKDQKIVDAFLGEGPGSKTFHKGDDGYYAMAGGDTGKAKWDDLSVHLGRDITHIEMVKEGGWMELGGKRVENVEHRVYYYYE